MQLNLSQSARANSGADVNDGEIGDSTDQDIFSFKLFSFPSHCKLVVVVVVVTTILSQHSLIKFSTTGFSR